MMMKTVYFLVTAATLVHAKHYFKTPVSRSLQSIPCVPNKIPCECPGGCLVPNNVTQSCSPKACYRWDTNLESCTSTAASRPTRTASTMTCGCTTMPSGGGTSCKARLFPLFQPNQETTTRS